MKLLCYMPYAYKLNCFFGGDKRTFNGRNEISHDPKGIKIQFYLVRFVYLLLLVFKQQTSTGNEEITLVRKHSGNLRTSNGACGKTNFFRYFHNTFGGTYF